MSGARRAKGCQHSGCVGGEAPSVQSDGVLIMHMHDSLIVIVIVIVIAIAIMIVGKEVVEG